MPDEFLGFDLSIERVGDAYRARVMASPAGPRAPIEIDPHGLSGELASTRATRRAEIRDIEKRATLADSLEKRGKQLFEAIFVDKVGEAFRQSVERARSQGKGLRVHLQMDGAPELAALSWEALWDPDEKSFLADSPAMLIARSLGVPEQAPVVEPVQLPFRIFALLPKGEPRLGGDTEWAQIVEALSDATESGEIQVDRIEPPTLENLGQTVANEPCHVLHIVAHGGPGGSGSGGQLELEKANGEPDPTTGGELTRALARQSAPRLVVLNACHGARAAVDDAFDGMAQHLLSRGIPAVVGMRTTISDRAAVAFAVALYRALSRGQTIEGAMIEARGTFALGPHRAEWATPVLYLRSPNVRILDLQTEDSLLPSQGRSARRLQRRVLPFAALLAAGLWGLWSWLSDPFVSPEPPPASTEVTPMVDPSMADNPCPPPVGLDDLYFVPIEPDVVALEDRTIVVTEPFCISTTEVSRRDWQEVMGGDLPRPDGSLDRPITHVTPAQAREFLDRLQIRHPGATYRLPNAAEWELAARAGTKTDYFFGDDPSELHEYGNCENPSASDGFERPAPVVSFRPNPWGLYNVHGNVSEWVQWSEGREGQIDDEGNEMALRLGGSFKNVPANCAFGYVRPVRADRKRDDAGFRVVRSRVEGE